MYVIIAVESKKTCLQIEMRIAFLNYFLGLLIKPIHIHGLIYGTLMGCKTSYLALWISYLAHFLKMCHKWDSRHEWVLN